MSSKKSGNRIRINFDAEKTDNVGSGNRNEDVEKSTDDHSPDLAPEAPPKRPMRPGNANGVDSPAKASRFSAVFAHWFPSQFSRLSTETQMTQMTQATEMTEATQASVQTEKSVRSAEYHKTMRVPAHPPALSLELDARQKPPNVQDNSVDGLVINLYKNLNEQEKEGILSALNEVKNENSKRKGKIMKKVLGVVLIVVLIAAVSSIAASMGSNKSENKDKSLNNNSPSPNGPGNEGGSPTTGAPVPAPPTTLYQKNELILAGILPKSHLCCPELRIVYGNTNFNIKAGSCGDTYTGIEAPAVFDATSSSECISFSLAEAINICYINTGARMCSLEELKSGVVASTGCGADDDLIFTGTTCVDPASGFPGVLVADGSNGDNEECLTDLENDKRIVRCCAYVDQNCGE